jgi:Holliday junction resolvase RusA-like endonuclease
MRSDGVLSYLGGEEWLRVKDIVRYTLVLDDDRSNDAWRKYVAEVFTDLAGLVDPLDEPVFLIATFYRPRPKNHLTSKGELSAEGKRNPKPITKPDSIKMMRSVEDALSGLAWSDDSRICDHIIRKRWATDEMGEGVHLMIWPDSICPVEVRVDAS